MKAFGIGLVLASMLTAGALAETPLDETDKAALLLEQSFRATAEIGVKEGLPVHTINRRPVGDGFDRLAPPPAPGEGQRFTCHSTAYCLQGYTARGTRVALGTIAVDPSVIPLGSLVYVHGYGWARALDTGGAVRGRFIDVWFPTAGQCYQWGSRPVQVVVFPPGKR